MVSGDITAMEVDAIINTANTALHMDSICDSIFYAAGIEKLQVACAKIAPIKVGEADVTPGFDLPARFIIHTATPIFKDGKHGEDELLEACYVNSLKLAVRNNCKSVALPLLSSGIYGYPQKDILRIATAAIRDFLAEHEINVYLIVPGRASLPTLTRRLGSVEKFLYEHYEGPDIPGVYKKAYQALRIKKSDPEQIQPGSMVFYCRHFDHEQVQAADLAQKLSCLTLNLDEPFSQTLLRLIDAKGKRDVDVYKRANIDRRLFSKIRNGKDYTPSKRTVIALAIALELKLSETEDLLKRAGYALSRSQISDVIVEYFIVNKKYDLFEINEVLFHYDQQLLGG